MEGGDEEVVAAFEAESVPEEKCEEEAGEGGVDVVWGSWAYDSKGRTPGGCADVDSGEGFVDVELRDTPWICAEESMHAGG